eukprot:m.239563 g.239563  ORF g.239563 m.239563 type:complete len:265 (+) comp22663_c0_seq1:69-863(+)
MAAKGKKAGSKSSKASAAKLEDAGPSMLEVSLRVELAQLEKELDVAKGEAADAKRKNEWLLAEMHRVEEETREYEAYMMKKTVQEQARIKNISEFNQQELDTIEVEKQKRIAEYEKQKRDIQDEILQQSAELERARKQLDDMAEMRRRRAAQVQEIKNLEETLQSLRSDHVQKLHALKTQCLEERVSFQRSSMASLTQLQTSAKHEALSCLQEQSAQVREENAAVRHHLLALMAANRALREREEILKKQSRELRRQIEITQGRG